ncbi:MAG: DUF1292 domain-containing protein [Oscillospiraceae bacterium]|jgi:hypothetical protein|nr:DUF1292 domain-containing protein [Oscillospiraceae bacterium]
MSEYGGDTITLTDEDGNEVELEHLDTLEYDGETYMAFGITEPDEEEEMAVIIMQAVKIGGEELLEEVRDERLLEEVYNLFLERVKEDDDEEEDEA